LDGAVNSMDESTERFHEYATMQQGCPAGGSPCRGAARVRDPDLIK